METRLVRRSEWPDDTDEDGRAADCWVNGGRGRADGARMGVNS